MNAGRRVGPPEEGLRIGGAIVDADDQLKKGFSRVEPHPVHALHPRHRVMLAQPDGGRAIRMLLDCHVRRQKRRRPVVLRPVELDATAGPRSGQPNQGRFDHRLVIHEIVSVGLVQGPVDATAECGQDHDQKVVVLDEDGLPRTGLRPLRDPVGKRQGIDAAAGSLIDPIFQKHRIWIRRARFISGQDDRLATDFHRRRGRHGVRKAGMILYHGGPIRQWTGFRKTCTIL